MIIFIFEGVSELTYNYHSGGSLLVIANDKDEVLKLVSTDNSIKLTDSDWDTVKMYNIVGEVDPTMYIFPDAGCC